MLVISLGLRILRILKPSLYADKGWRIIYTRVVSNLLRASSNPCLLQGRDTSGRRVLN